MVRIAGDDASFLELPPSPAAITEADIPRRQSQRHFGTDARLVEIRLDKVLSKHET